MKTATIREAQHHLAKLLAEVELGEEIVLTRRGEPVGKLVPISLRTRIGDKVDWTQSTKRVDELLGDLPRSSRNPVVEMREEERF